MQSCESGGKHLCVDSFKLPLIPLSALLLGADLKPPKEMQIITRRVGNGVSLDYMFGYCELYLVLCAYL